MSLLLPPRQAAAHVGIGRTKLLALEKAGRIKSKILDGRRFFLVASLDQFVKGLPSANDNAPESDRLGDLLLQSIAQRRGKRPGAL